MTAGLDLDRITREAQEYVAGLTDSEVLAQLTNIENREAKKKQKQLELKERKKKVEQAIIEKGAHIRSKKIHQVILAEGEPK